MLITDVSLVHVINDDNTSTLCKLIVTSTKNILSFDLEGLWHIVHSNRRT
jgi:hypothetical protein